MYIIIIRHTLLIEFVGLYGVLTGLVLGLKEIYHSYYMFYVFIHSFIHSQHLHSASSRNYSEALPNAIDVK